MPEPLRVAVIGAGGRIAADWLAAVDAIDVVRVTALVESGADARARLGAAPDVDAMLAAGVPDAAIVATPPSTHEPIAIALLDAGVHVLCEKPLATDLAAAERMVAAAGRAGRTLMMASKFRFVDDVVEARRRIDDGAVGRPVFYDNAFCSEVDMTGRWNADPAVSGGGVLIDNGAHAVDLARCLLGEIDRVLAAQGPRLAAVPVEDSVRLLFETAGGALGRADLSWSVATGAETYAAVHGSAGSIELGWRGARVRVGDRWTGFGSGYDKRRAFRTQLEHFADVVRGDAAPRIGDADAIASVRFVAAAQRAMTEGRWVTIEEAR